MAATVSTCLRSYSTSAAKTASMATSALRVCVVGSGVGGLSTAHHVIKVGQL